MKEKILKPIFSFFSNRIFILLVVICALFYFLVAELFQLQIVEGEAHQATLSATIAKEVDLSAQRGNIYDRYGRPLAVNQFAYSVLIDPSITMANDGELNNVILNLVNLLEANGEEYIDDLPISADEPYEFTFHNDEEKTKQVKWIINQMSLSKDETEAAEMSPYYVLELLRDRFEIDESMTNAQARKVISIRTKMWLIRYYSYNPVEIATNVSMDTVTRIEEDADKYKSIIVDKVASRYYPEGEYLAHIVGYVGRINSDEYDTYVSQKGYDASDIVGKTGIELAFEDNLRGTAGSQTVIVNTSGRKVSDIEGSRVDPKQGDKVFLTIDAALQRELYDKTVETLKEVIIGRLTSIDPKVWPLTAKEVYSSMVAANNLSPKEIFESQPGSYSHEVKQYVLSVNPEANVDSNEERLAINQLIAEGIEDDSINLKTIILVMWEQGIITGDAYYVERIKNGWVSPTQVLVDKIKADEITPAMTNVDPSTASVVMVDVKTGDVLAAVSYPSFDTNEYMNNINTVFPKLNNDPAKPMYNRAFQEERPPGSTFKMVTAATGLETGAINVNTTIHDDVTFTKVGKPEPSCWNKSGHGSINVVGALEGSCNYFFFETMYRLGSSKTNNKMQAMAEINKYMSLFALDEPSGVEIGETGKARGKSPLNMASPELKEYLYSGNLKETSDWMDGDTMQTAMGQGFNNYTPAVMARYITIIANKGEKYDLHLLSRLVTSDDVLEYLPRHSNIGSDISDNTWSILYSGMREVITGSAGTAKNIFAGFPVSVAGKTGTAEQIKNRPEHTSFGGFAPYENPEVTVYAMIPFSDAKATASPATILARKALESYFKLDTTVEAAEPANALMQ